MPCAIPCDILPCSLRCDKVLKCGHQCPSLCGELCPGVDFCQKCGPKSVKEAVVDYIEGRTYAEIDLDHDPCLFPDCGHVITMQSLDGQMGLSAHYEMSKDGLPTEPKSQVSAPLSVEAKGCPLCRGSLRNLNRYNRIVKRALLDESTKRFITWSNAQFVPLTVQLQKAEKDLEGLKEKQVVLTKDDKKPEFQHSEIVIAGVRDLQISILHALPGFASRVGRLIVLRHQIAQFHQRVMVTEQPFGKVSQMTATVVRSTGHAPNFKFDKTVLQTRSELLASSLLLRCDYDLLADLIYTCSNCNIFTAQLHPWVRKPLKFDLSKNREDCVKLAGSAALKQQPMIFVEAHTLFAKFAALECSAPAYPENVNVTKLMDQAKDHLELARSHIFASPSLNSKIMLAEVEAVEEILKDSSFYKSFYTSVESDEKQAIYNAMAQEFQGTGHWYYCENAHPVSHFVISPKDPACHPFEQTTDCRVCNTVHHRRMRDADASLSMPPMRRSRGGPEPRSCRRSNSRCRSGRSVWQCATDRRLRGGVSTWAFLRSTKEHQSIVSRWKVDCFAAKTETSTTGSTDHCEREKVRSCSQTVAQVSHTILVSLAL